MLLGVRKWAWLRVKMVGSVSTTQQVHDVVWDWDCCAQVRYFSYLLGEIIYSETV